MYRPLPLRRQLTDVFFEKERTNDANAPERYFIRRVPKRRGPKRLRLSTRRRAGSRARVKRAASKQQVNTSVPTCHRTPQKSRATGGHIPVASSFCNTLVAFSFQIAFAITAELMLDKGRCGALSKGPRKSRWGVFPTRRVRKPNSHSVDDMFRDESKGSLRVASA